LQPCAKALSLSSPRPTARGVALCAVARCCGNGTTARLYLGIEAVVFSQERGVSGCASSPNAAAAAQVPGPGDYTAGVAPVRNARQRAGSKELPLVAFGCVRPAFSARLGRASRLEPVFSTPVGAFPYEVIGRG
jgi:hypothetical protein